MLETNTISKAPVLIAGGGIGGMAMALTLHQIGVPCVVLEAVPALQPLGVGINLQPNAVRELYELGLDDTVLDRIGIQAREWALVGRNGREIYAEPRGLAAGYRWPQYSVHRGELQMLLYRAVRERLGPDAVRLGQRVTGYRNHERRRDRARSKRRDGRRREVRGAPAGGRRRPALGRARADAPAAAAHPLGRRHHVARHHAGRADPHAARLSSAWAASGTAWSATRSPGPTRPPAWRRSTGSPRSRWTTPTAGRQGDWNRRVAVDEFIHHFEGWNYGWIDVPALLRGASQVFEYPMIDRDPVPTWVDGRVALLGDAAHVMYPVGSNGASQAIVDARVLGAALEQHGVGPAALRAYDDRLCADISALVLRNRGAGPFGLLGLVDERCGGVFDDIDQVVPKAEREAFMARYKAAAGFAIETLNAAVPTVRV
ncbi:MAG: FAD-dependent monooxygenase [Pseudorhodoferax sp.]